MQRSDLNGQLFAEQQGEFIAEQNLAGLGHGDGQHVVRLQFQRNEVIAEHQVRGNLPEKFRIDALFPQIHKGAAVALRQTLGSLPLVLLVASGYCCYVGVVRGRHEISFLPVLFPANLEEKIGK